MVLWSEFVGLFQGAMVLLAQAFGGNMGLAIFVVSLAARAMLLPLTLHLARRSLAHQRLLQALKPKLDALKERFKNDPERSARETMRVFKESNVSPLPWHGLLGALIQWPVFVALFSATRRCLSLGGRFLWIPSIARPDVLLGAVVAVLACLTALVAPNLSDNNRALMIAISVIITFVVVSRMAAGMGLYFAAVSVVGIAQGALLRRGKGNGQGQSGAGRGG